jgi:hypothetical protein
MNGDLDSTQILTQHCGAQSQTISQLMNLGTMPTSKYSQLRPSELTKHLRTGSVQIPYQIMITRTEPWDFIKSSVIYLSVHMELSLRLSFYPRRSCGGYIVGTVPGNSPTTPG